MAPILFKDELLIDIGLDYFAHENLPMLDRKFLYDLTFKIDWAFVDHGCCAELTVENLEEFGFVRLAARHLSAVVCDGQEIG